VANAFLGCQAPHTRDDVVGGPAGGLIDVQDACEGFRARRDARVLLRSSAACA
jgi:hypothetical protein